MGWAYFVDNGPYSEFIKGYVDQDEVCSCDQLVDSDFLLMLLTDSDLCWLPSTPQHAHEEVEGSPCDWYGGSELCPPPTLPPVGYG
jgi:hypothetical protein